MKTIGFKDIVEGSMYIYSNKNQPKQTRWDRFYEALNELKHTGNIITYRVNGSKVKKLSVKRI